LTGTDEGTYIVNYKQNGISEGTINVRLTVLLAIKTDGDVYDYSTVSG